MSVGILATGTAATGRWLAAQLRDVAADQARFQVPRPIHPALAISPDIQLAATMAESLLERVDFASIGTNDLAQYEMAADRMSLQLAVLTDP